MTAFKDWLVSEQYADTTVQVTLFEVALAKRLLDQDQEVPKRLSHALKRFIAFSRLTHQNVSEREGYEDVLESFKNPDRGGIRGGRKKKLRKKESVSIGNDEWAELLEAVRADESNEARVLEVLFAHGMRISDVLRMGRRVVETAATEDSVQVTVKGGKKIWLSTRSTREQWGHLLDRMKKEGSTDIGKLVCDKGTLLTRCAARRVERKLKELAQQTGVSGRIHLHRLRRTVGVQALKASGGNVHAVKQLLGHDDYNTTLGYVDEADVVGLAALQEKLT